MVASIERSTTTFTPGQEVRFLVGDRKGKTGVVTDDKPSDPLDYGSIPVKVAKLKKPLWVNPNWLEAAQPPFEIGGFCYLGDVKARIEKIYPSVKKADIVPQGEIDTVRVSWSELKFEAHQGTNILCNLSSASSQELLNSAVEESPKQDCPINFESLNSLSATNTGSDSSSSITPIPQSTTTSAPTLETQESLLSPSAEVPAKTTAPPTLSAQDLQAIALDFGGKCSESPTNADLTLSSGRIQQDADTPQKTMPYPPLEWFSGHLPPAGMCHSGNQSAPVMLERHTSGIESSLLPTPMTCSSNSTVYRRPGQDKLEKALKPFMPEGHVSHPNIREWMMGVPLDWTLLREESGGEILSEPQARQQEFSPAEESEPLPLETAALPSNQQCAGDMLVTSVISSDFEVGDIELTEYSEDDTEVPLTIVAPDQQLDRLAEDTRMRLKRTAKDIWQIGENLVKAREILGHGDFLPWIDKEFGMKQRSAYRFMNVAENLKGKFANLANLEIPISIIYELAAPTTDESAREEILGCAQRGEKVSVAAAKAAIARHKPSPKSKPTSSAIFSVGDLVKVSGGEYASNSGEIRAVSESYAKIYIPGMSESETDLKNVSLHHMEPRQQPPTSVLQEILKQQQDLGLGKTEQIFKDSDRNEGAPPEELTYTVNTIFNPLLNQFLGELSTFTNEELDLALQAIKGEIDDRVTMHTDLGW